MVRHKKPYALRLRSLFLWHRYLGLSAALFVLGLAVTGLSIAYSDDLRLANRYVQVGWLLDWYGIPPPAVVVGYPVAGHWVTQVGERLYFDDKEVAGGTVPLHGAVETPDGLAVAGGDQLLLMTAQGAVIDRLGALEGLPAGIEAVGRLAGQLVVHTPRGDYQGDTRTLAWQSMHASEAAWVQAAPLPAALRSTLIRRYRGAGVSWERVMLDLHSGRLFGRFGVWVVNLAGVLMMLLAITGVWHFFRRKR